MRQSRVLRLLLALALVSVLAGNASIGLGAVDAAQQGTGNPADIVPGEIVIQYKRGVRPAQRDSSGIWLRYSDELDPGRIGWRRRLISPKTSGRR